MKLVLNEDQAKKTILGVITINPKLVQWHKGILSMLNEGGKWAYPDGNSAWQRNGNTITLIHGNIKEDANLFQAAHIFNAGFDIVSPDLEMRH